MRRLPIFIALIIVSAAQAYNVETHGFYTFQAFRDSDLTINATELNLRLGFDRVDLKRPFEHAPPGDPIVPGCTGLATEARRDAYLDPTGGWLTANPPPDTSNVKFRCAYEFEKVSMPPDYSGKVPAAASVGPFGFYRIEGWLMRGAIREDDFEFSAYENPNLRPDRDPWNDGFRSLYHFYNPITNTSGGLFTNSGMSWALGIPDSPAGNANIDSQVPDPSRGNHFSYMDARRNFFLALTYKRPGTSTFVFTRQDSDVRTNLMASTFISIGHVVHLLQDFAQPQHVRAEPHNFLCRGIASLLNQDIATRTYENFINFRVIYPYEVVTGNKTYDIGSGCEETKWRDFFRKTDQIPPASTGPWASSSYPIPQFSKQRKFFTTRVEDAAVLDRRGLADYTNRGFYTEDKFAGNFTSPPATLDDPSFSIGPSDVFQVPGKGNVTVQQNYWAVPDRVAPGFADPNLRNGKAPIFSTSLWKRIRMGIPTTVQPRGYMTLRNYNQMADMLAPRAIAYSAGLINFFFRGKLDIEPIDQKIFAVLNQGAAHTVDADGYPRKPDGSIFGFEKIRLKVRNSTELITESGSNVAVPQIVGAGKLVAIARYHRNACYKPDLSGERTQTFATPPLLAGIITEPSCAAGSTRTNFQEISVSADLAISSEADLPGGRSGTPPATLEKTFDFSADPIPINATDLIIQVVYRGQLGEETDGIALGAVDVREPTIVTFWNNSDFYYDGTALPWKPFNVNYPLRPIQFFRFCFGPNSAERLGYWYAPPLAANAMIQNQQTRLAVIPAPPTSPTDTFRVKGTPVTTAGVAVPGSMQPLVRTAVGRIAQANREFIAEMTQNLPACQAVAPSLEFWCNEPLQRRRSILLGAPLQPLAWVASVSSGFNTADAGEFMTPAVGTVQALGEVRFNDNAALANCPIPPSVLNKSDAEIRLQELEEVARSFGVVL